MLPGEFLIEYPIFEEVDASIIETELVLADEIFTSTLTPNIAVLEKLKGLYVAHHLSLDYNRQLNLALMVKGVETGQQGQGLIQSSGATFYKDTIYGSKLLSLLRRVRGTTAFNGRVSL